MGLTKASMSENAKNDATLTKKDREDCRIIALAGNPNVGKSSVFNILTGLNQHTGNWAGKTVANQKGYYTYKDERFLLVDLPGTYSIVPDSSEEEIARDFICFENSEKTVVVCDATCLERNINLALQILEIKNNVIICINLIDEAEKKNIIIDEKKLSQKLKCDVVLISAKKKKGIEKLKEKISEKKESPASVNIFYDDNTEQCIYEICSYLNEKTVTDINMRWIALKLIENDNKLIKKLSEHLGYDFPNDVTPKKIIEKYGMDSKKLIDDATNLSMIKSKEITDSCVKYENKEKLLKNRKIDKWINNRITGIPIMLICLFSVFWITISGANYPSEMLSNFLFSLEDRIYNFLKFINIPVILCDISVKGIYRVVSWVVSVMLPPMAIFFPLFTLLEDLGFLPRIAFNTDRIFKKCNSCGKHSLCIAMGFGCNAAGVVGARIIDSKRERLIAILTNSFIPCNGRFPTLIAIITMFFASKNLVFSDNFISALILTFLILFSIAITLIVSKALSETLLKGYPSSFVLELPPYRIPKIGSVIIRSIYDRTLFVLARAVSVAIPAGLIIWLFSNITANNISILSYFCDFLNPLGHLMGLDGNILMAFILGFPANEIVLPIALMSYLGNGELTQITALNSIKEILITNGWTYVTAINFMIFSVFHWPCSTTFLTIKKETGSLKWAIFSVILPTLIGFILCVLFNFILK